MSLSAALHAAVAVLRRRPADLLPIYMLGAAVPAIARVGAFAGVAVAYAYLEVTGRLDAVLAGLVGRDLNPPDPETSPDAFAEWVDGLAPVLEPLFSPVVVGALLVGLLVTLVVALVLAAAISAGQVSACAARLRDERGLTAGVVGLRRHWPAFLAAFVVEGLVWVVSSFGVLLVIAVAAALSSVAAIVVAPVAAVGWLAVVVATRAVFAFVPVVIVVEDAGLEAAVRGSVGFIRLEPVGTAGYYALAVGALVAFSTLAGLLTLLEIQAVAAPIALLVFSPALDLVKTGLVVDDRGTLDPPSGPVADLREGSAVGLRRGLREVGRFVRRAPGLHALVLALAVAGAAMGWAAAGPLVGSLDASIAERLADHVPPAAALNFFGNNWTVAISTAFAGTAAAVPAALSVWFNGLFFGVLARLEVAPLALAAFAVPHGIFEIPSLIVAGALGLHLGIATWRTWRGRTGRESLADALERAFWVLVGLGVLFALAGLIEGFVSPYYWRPFLGA